MIELAYPVALIALIAIPILLALHLLQPRRRRVVLSSIALWQAAAAAREGAHGLRKLLRNLSLLLLLLTAAALGVALAGPEWITYTDEANDVVLVLDVSASMKARSGPGRTRFDEALAEARAIVDALPRNGRMLIMTSGRKPLIRSGFESDRGALVHVLSQLRPADESGNAQEALSAALALLRGRSHGKVYFITDGAIDSEPDPGSPQVAYRRVGAPARNVAITRFDLRAEPGEERFQVLMTVRNYTDAPVVVPASARLDDALLFERRLQLAARGEETLVVTVPGRAVGQAAARIDVDDDLDADNSAFAALNAPAVLHILLVSPGNVYLQSVLEALAGAEVAVTGRVPQDDIAELARSYDVIVLDRVTAPRLPPGSFLLVDTVAPGLPFTEEGRVERPAIAGKGPSALVRDVDLGALRIEQARRVAVRSLTPGLQRLFWSDQTDLGLALLDGGLKLVYLGFDITRSNFPLQAAFPLFMSQSLEWLRPREIATARTQIAAGLPYTIHLPPAQSEVRVRTPSGKVETLQVHRGTARFEATGEAGIYRYGDGEATRHFAVNLTDARESDINALRTLPDRTAATEGSARSVQALLPLWPYLLLAAAALLALEWFVWRGSRGHA